MLSCAPTPEGINTDNKMRDIIRAVVLNGLLNNATAKIIF
jgi:hypothetical protein